MPRPDPVLLAARAVLPVMLALKVGLAQGDPAGANLERPAHFRVSTEVVNADVAPFVATTSAMGNARVWTFGGFEPTIARDVFQTNQDSDNEIHAEPSALSHWEIFNERVLEGAEVEIWRIVDGTMRLVRSDRVAPGGAHLSGWWPLYDLSRIIPADRTQHLYRWDTWNATDAKYFYCVRSVDASGRESPCSAAASVLSPHDLHLPGRPAERTQAFTSRMLLFKPKLEAPSGFKAKLSADGAVQFSWDAVNGNEIAGYRIYRADSPPELHSGYFLALQRRASSPQERIRKGDWIMWHKKLYAVSPHDFPLHSGTSVNGYVRFLPGAVDFPSDEGPTRQWELALHPLDSPVEDHGETYLRLTLGPGEKARIGLEAYGGADNGWYEPLKPGPWRLSAWMRQEPGGSGKVQMVVTGPMTQTAWAPRLRSFDVGSKWKLQFESFAVKELIRGKDQGWVGLEFTGPATFCIDNFNFGRGDVDFLAFEPEERKALHDSGMRALRTHMFFPVGPQGYDFEQFTNSGGAINGVLRRVTLPQMLSSLRSAQVDPWLEMPLYFRPQDWQALIEYLAAPYDPAVDTPKDKPWAYKRYRQGHPAPWSDDFGQLFFELGNETWNRTFGPWNWPTMTDAATGASYHPGEVYGLYQEQVIQTMKASRWWKLAGLDRKVRFVIGGWIINESFSFGAARYAPSADYVTGAPYIGGWDWGEGPRPDIPASYFEVLNDVSQTAVPTADNFRIAADRLNSKRTHKIALGTYESGPGYAQNGLNNQQVSPAEADAQERVMKSLSSGTATLDSFLARAYRGFTLQSYFTFEHGIRWTSHQQWWLGGQAWPAWKMLALFNNEGTGSMLKVDSLSVPTWPLPDMPGRKKVSLDSPLVGAYALRRGSRFNLILASRKVPGYPIEDSNGYTPVEVDLPFRRFGTVTLFRTVGKYNDNNLLDDRVQIERVVVHPDVKQQRLTLGTSAGTDDRGLAPGTILLYVFEDTDLP
jgi:hypothetical protein